MKTCPKCKREYEDKAKFCRQDGTPLVRETDPLVGQMFADRYEIEALIGTGRTGKVYRARPRLNIGPVALKVFAPELTHDPAWMKELKDYLQRATRLHHPHIVVILDLGTDASGRFYMVMDYVEGRTLDKELQRPNPLPTDDRLEVVEQIAKALDAAHAAGIFYNPLRPADVLVTRTPEGRPLVKLLPPSWPYLSANITSAGIVSTDAHYTAPETFTNAPATEPDARADIYSLGAICYELFAWRKPYEGLPPVQMLHKQLAGEPPSLGLLVPAAVAPIIERALRKERSERPPNADEFAAEVRDVLKHEEEIGARGRVITLGSIGAKPPGKSTGGLVVEPSPVNPTETVNASRGDTDAQRPLYADENVQFTVYQPEAVAPGKWYTLLAFAHLSKRRPDAPPDEPDPVAEVQRIAARVLADQPAAYDAVKQQSLHAVPHKSLLTFVPYIEGVEFNPQSASFNWLKSVHKVEFEMCAAAALDGQVARGRLTVFIGSLILADVPLAIRVDSAYMGAPRTPPTVVADAVPYRNIFASYSHNDREIVEHIEHYVQTLGDKYLRDVTALRSGQDWRRWMKEAIDAADIFQLFWSRNSMRSDNVRIEWEYALSLGRANFVRPVYWETPLPESPAENLPPPALRNAHFQHLRPDLSTHPAAPEEAPARETAAPPPVFNPRGAPPISSPPAEAKSAPPSSNAGDKCPQCGAAVAAEKAFCQECGASMIGSARHSAQPGQDFGATVIVPPAEWPRMAQPGAASAPPPTATQAEAVRDEALSVFWEKRPRERGTIADAPYLPSEPPSARPARLNPGVLWLVGVLLLAALLLGIYLVTRFF
jgi:serine/threonine protein kinase